MIDFLMKHPDKIWNPLWQHIVMVTVTIVLSVLLASVISLLVLRSIRASQIVIGLFNGIYCIPSLALFAILIPFMGLGMKTAVFVLVIYNQFYLVRSMVSGIRGVDAAVVEAARGIGMTEMQALLWVRLPLASPALIAGLKLSVISTVGIATIAATISAGGLGSLLMEGLRIRNYVKIFWGVLLAAGMNIAADASLTKLQRYAEKRSRGIVAGTEKRGETR